MSRDHRANSINDRQLMILMVFFTVGSAILVVPSPLTAIAGHDAWIASLMGLLFSFGIMYLYSMLGRRYPNLNFIQMNQKLLGPWLGSIFSWAYVLNALLIGVTGLMYYASDFLTREILVGTPPYAINLLLSVVIAMGGRLGLRTFSYTAEVLFPLFILFFVVLILFSTPSMEIERILPIIDTGGRTLVQGAVFNVCYSTCPVVFVLMLYPASMKRSDGSSNRLGLWMGNIIGGLILFGIIMASVLVLDPELIARQLFPSYTLAKHINVGRVITRIEVLMAAIWLIAVYFKLMMYFYAGMIGLAQLLRIKHAGMLTYPLVSIILPLSLVIYPNLFFRESFDLRVWPILAVLMGVGQPLMLVIVSSIRRWYTQRHQPLESK
ncbi:GerAB/ArcD/ProY family transporter [Paenibacillus guangzhouensis]|uniref:GerAB/ArcD/ProY family transporter n=1 Tax=Paenibacillus guangzhouensis TaxID=1473112 RepID=UPI001267501A|nr:endospore germination permease [Paenibacillus guangzhouensis]